MNDHPNYRVAVEVIILYDNKILQVKRSEDLDVAPGIWHVPAGKLKLDETPLDAVYRVAKKETNLDIELIKELGVAPFASSTPREPVYRLVYTFLARPKHDDISNLALSAEHTEYTWVDRHDENRLRVCIQLQEAFSNVLDDAS
jgi:8-oxo-dGTP diphosphatase